MNKNRLEAKVQARNEANRLANEISAALAPVIAPFVGQKIVLQTGGTSAKLEKAFLPLREKFPGVHYWVSSGHGYSLSVSVKVSKPYELEAKRGRAEDYVCGTAYADAYVHLGDISGGVLTKLRETPSELRTNFSADAILATRKEVKEARAVLQAAESNLAGFGDHDN